MMGKYCFSFPARSLFAMLIALLLLLLLLQSPYSGSAASGKSSSGARSRKRQAGEVLPEQEVTALNDILGMSTLQFLPKNIFTVNSCSDNSIRNIMDCKCDPKPICHHVLPKTISAESSEPGSSNNSQGSSAADNEQKPGIDCDQPTPPRCHVQGIYLDGQKLNGVIPSSLVNLTRLELLDLSDNDLTGEIPGGVLASLKRLKYLYLNGNFLNGSIPKELGGMTSLSYLSLGKNFLKGSIPKELGALMSLSFLSLWANTLTGEIPEELGNLTNLTYLDLSSNQLTGKLPVKLGQLKRLETLDLNDNTITGALPKELSNLKNLKLFNAIGNSFSGRIPEEIGNWEWLNILKLQGNDFEGPFPKAISRLENLTHLSISDLNDTTGQGLPFPDIAKLKYLESLSLRNCSIKGKIPEYIGKMATLTSIDLSFNHLDGELPKEIDKLKLDYLFLTGNKLTGSIPSWDSNWTRMHADLSHNNFTKVSFKCDMSMANKLNLYKCCSPTTPNLLAFEWQKSNFFCLKGKRKSTSLFINSGGAEDKIKGNSYEADSHKGGPSTIYFSKNSNWAYSSTGDFRGDGDPSNYQQNRTCGITMADAPILKTARLSPMSLKYYGHCLKSGNYNVTLYFAEIIFTDDDDDSDHSKNGKRVFDVFIQGSIVLKDFNIKKEAGGPKKEVVKSFPAVVTKNGVLEIHFYWAGKGSTDILPRLYGPLISAVSVTPAKKRKLSAVKIVGIAGSAVFLIILLSVFLWKMGWLGKKGLHDEGLKALVQGFNFQQIKAATRNFHSDNKIGEGGFGPVYKGVLPNGMTIAVKKLSSKSKQGIREFMNEVGTISALRHTNLVRLLGCCTENNQLLLVYEYMENNSLSSALFASAGPGSIKTRLNWSTRFNICLGIAKGLAFLHEESKLKIIHRDIKPTNVLLDKDLTAKISDFGLAKHNEGEQTHIITKVAGTSGYMAPEYAMRGLLTFKADVYSFGVVMLEIVSGKNSTVCKPNDETIFLLDLAYVLQQKGDLLDLMDPELKMDYSVKEATRVLELAMCCTNPSPTLRPSMSEAVSILEGKTKMKKSSTSMPLHAPYSVDEFRRANLIADLSLSTHSGSTSGEKLSSFFSSCTSMEEKLDRPVQNPLHEISD